MKTNHLMKTKLLPRLVVSGFTILALGICPFALAQTDPSPAPAVSPSAQTTPTQQMQGMDSTPDSMKQMAEMCQKMMRNEEAAMPYIIGASVPFGVLLFVALVLFIILEILSIKYWRRIVRDKSFKSPQ